MILAGRGVHEAEGVLELVARMGTLPAPKLREVAPQVSEAVARIVDRAVEFKREDRYPSAAAMRADVQAALAALAPAPESAAPVSARSRIDQVPPAPVSEAPRSRRSVAPYVLALLVAAGVVLVFVPQARERAGMPNAVSDLFSSSASLSASASSASALSSASSAPSSALASASASALALASASGAPEDPAAALADLADASLDASSDAGDRADAGDAGDDDDDDDDVDASDVAAIIGSHDGGAVSGAHPLAAKHPRVHAPRHGRPPRKKRRPRR
jgi:hypothetical protein